MSDILSAIQRGLLEKLEGLKEFGLGVFTHVPANSKFPYLHLGKIELKDRSCKTHQQIDAIINVTIYSRDRQYGNLFKMVDEVKKQVIIGELAVDGFHLFNLVLMGVEIDQKPDGVTSFANIKYKLSMGE